MKEFQSRRRTRRIIFSWPVILIFLIVVAWLFSVTFRHYLNAREARRERLEVENSIAEISAKNNILAERLDDLGSEVGIERILRERFNVKKPGEHVLVIVDRGGDEDENDKQSGNGFFSRLLGAIMNIF